MTTYQDVSSSISTLQVIIDSAYYNSLPKQAYRRDLLMNYSNSPNISVYSFNQKEYTKIIKSNYNKIEDIFGGMIDLSNQDMKNYKLAVKKLSKPLGININDL